MKTILLLVRHFFPRKRWEVTDTTNVWEREDSKRPCEKIITMRDQFGNIRTKRIKG